MPQSAKGIYTGINVVSYLIATIRIAGRLPVARLGENMKEKTWKVVANTGKRADLESGTERTGIQKPDHISTRDFTHRLAPGCKIDDSALESMFRR